MAKAKFMDNAKELEAQARELFERIKKTHTDMSGTLQEVRRAEGTLVERERTAERERVEAERAERLKELLESDGDLAYHVGERDEFDEAPKAEAPKAEAPKAEAPKAEAPKAEAPKAEAPKAEAPKAEAPKAEAPKAEAPKAEAPKAEAPKAEAPKAEAPKVEAPKAEAPKAEAPKAEAPKAEAPKAEAPKAEAPKVEAPVTEAVRPAAPVQQRQDSPRQSGYQAQPQAATANQQPRQNQYGNRQGGYQQGGYQPRTDNRQGGYQQGGYQPRTDNRQGGYQQGGYQPRTDNRQGGYQQGGYQPRTGTQGGYQPRTGAQGGYQPRTGAQGGYQPRTGAQGGYQPRTGAQGGYQPRTQGGYQPRTGAQGGYQPRTDRPAGRPTTDTPTTGAPQDRSRTYDANTKRKSVSPREDDRRNKNKKSMLKEAAPAPVWDDDNSFSGRKRGRKQQAPQPKMEVIKIEKAVITSEMITVKELSEKIGKPAAEIIKKLFILGILATINQEIDFDTCSLIASDYGIELEQNIAKTAEDVLMESSDETDADDHLEARPPVVTIMGHVDHGKTSLLDAIRHSAVTEGEAGGITQHIGAYTVNCNGRQITFIDTPGHEAFTAMRARGAQVTDIVILVVAADDGIMPQTIEAINHSKAAGVPIIVAINKMDRPAADPDRVKQQLTEYGLVSEEWGGETICVPVSAKTKLGLESLLEMVLLQADVLELKANPNRLAKGTIIEAQLDKGRGPIATVLVQNGTLNTGDTIVAGTAFGRVRAMVDDKGRRVNSAGPSTPVEVLGFSEVPSAGDILNVAELDKLSRQVAEERRDKQKAEQLKNLSKVSLDDLFNQIAEGDIKDLNLIIKADVQGSVEAVKQALEKLSNDEVRVKCIHGAVGAINGSDVMFASASNAIIIGFNVRPDSTARATAEKEKVDIRLYRIIYNAIEDIEAAMKGMFKPVFKENELGHAEVRNTFKVSGVGTIAGCYVKDGKILRNAEVRVTRDNVVVHEGKISSLKRFKDDVKEVAQGYECGISIENYNDVHEGDVIEAFVMEEVKR